MGSAFKSRSDNPNKIINSGYLGLRRAAFSRSFLIILGAPILMGLHRAYRPLLSPIRVGAELRNQRSSMEQAMCLGPRAINVGNPTVREGATATIRDISARWYNKLDMTTLLGKTEDELMEFAEGIGEARFRGKQIYRAIYGRRALDVARMTELSKDLREKLNSIARVAETRIIDVFYSTDGTRRYLLRLGDGREAEAVFMPEERRDTICLSCQVGCAVGCGFCMTAVGRQ